MLQNTGRSRTKKFARKGVQVFFAVVLAATFMLAVPNSAQADNYYGNLGFHIQNNYDYLTPQRNHTIDFNESLPSNYVGYGYYPRAELIRIVQGCTMWCSENYPYSASPIWIDGLFGAKTDAAIRSYQSKHELIVDGYCGVDTWRSLWVYVSWSNEARIKLKL